jgi:hypothetical protein
MLICLSRRKEELEEDRRRNRVPHLHTQEIVLRTENGVYFIHNRPALTTVEIQYRQNRLTINTFYFASAFIITEPREFNRYTDGLGGMGSIPARDKNFSLLPSVQTGSGAHQAPYSVGTGGKAEGA